MPLTDRDGTRIHWTERGEGHPVLLLHGLGGDAGFWESEATALADGFRVIAVDARGSGESSASPDAFTMNDLAADLVAVLDDAEVQSSHVVGFSMGGLIAQSLAAEHPERVRRLVLASTYAVMNSRSRLFLDAVHDVYRDGASTKQMFHLICPWLFSESFLADPANAMWLDYPDDAADDQTVDDWSRLYLAQRAFDGSLDLGRILASTLVLSGGCDALVSASDSTQLARRIPGARLELFERSGHLLNVEEPRRFLEAVRDHLAAH